MVEKFRVFRLWDDKAKEYGADPIRVNVWDALSEHFLDTSHTEGELDWIAENIANSPYSFRELGHILFEELGPVCVTNFFQWPGGEWAMFDPDWLIPRCLKRQRRTPFRETKNLDELPFHYHIFCPPFFDAYLMLYRVKRLRDSPKD